MFRILVVCAVIGVIPGWAGQFFTTQNPMPTFKNSQRQALAQVLYDLYRRSGSQAEGIDALRSDKSVWIPWASSYGEAIVAAKEVVSHESLRGPRDKALESVMILSAAFIEALEQGRGSKDLLARVQRANAELQHAAGPGLYNPCSVSGLLVPEDCGDERALELQEQWSFLRVMALTYVHFVTTLHPLIQGGLTGWDEVTRFEKAFVSLNTDLFTSGLEIREGATTGEIAKRVGLSPQTSAQDGTLQGYIKLINSNLLLALPRMTDKQKNAFIGLLGGMQQFIGTDSAQLAQDTRNIIIYWHVLIMGLAASFDALKRAEQHQGKVQPNKLNLKVIPWGTKPLAPHVDPVFENWLRALTPEVKTILECNEWALGWCLFPSSQQKYATFLIMTRYLHILIQKVNESLEKLKVLDRHGLSAQNTGNS